ncbi:MAG: hypothetical protein MZV70_40145 [Desulfobacterales bacterium]|nr:hypothetical protein [Desulfobacterales bacterium]
MAGARDGRRPGGRDRAAGPQAVRLPGDLQLQAGRRVPHPGRFPEGARAGPRPAAA